MNIWNSETCRTSPVAFREKIGSDALLSSVGVGWSLNVALLWPITNRRSSSGRWFPTAVISAYSVVSISPYPSGVSRVNNGISIPFTVMDDQLTGHIVGPN